MQWPVVLVASAVVNCSYPSLKWQLNSFLFAREKYKFSLNKKNYGVHVFAFNPQEKDVSGFPDYILKCFI